MKAGPREIEEAQTRAMEAWNAHSESYVLFLRKCRPLADLEDVN